MMKTTITLAFFSCAALFTGCQSTSQQFNGKTGYTVEQQGASTATLAYTLASKQNPERESHKLQDACKQTLGANKTYDIKILDTQEISSPDFTSEAVTGVKLGGTNTSFGFSNTPHLNSNQEAYAVRQVEETRPSVLKIVRYTCS